MDPKRFYGKSNRNESAYIVIPPVSSEDEFEEDDDDSLADETYLPSGMYFYCSLTFKIVHIFVY